jgi:hypothetical protein
MTVQELFEKELITPELIEERSDESPYWESCHKFINDKWTTELRHLSEKQEAWADRILEDMVEWRIEK